MRHAVPLHPRVCRRCLAAHLLWCQTHRLGVKLLYHQCRRAKQDVGPCSPAPTLNWAYRRLVMTPGSRL